MSVDRDRQLTNPHRSLRDRSSAHPPVLEVRLRATAVPYVEALFARRYSKLMRYRPTDALLSVSGKPLKFCKAGNAWQPGVRPPPSLLHNRKNWPFSDTPKSATASAQLYSLVETAKANG